MHHPEEHSLLWTKDEAGRTDTREGTFGRRTKELQSTIFIFNPCSPCPGTCCLGIEGKRVLSPFGRKENGGFERLRNCSRFQSLYRNGRAESQSRALLFKTVHPLLRIHPSHSFFSKLYGIACTTRWKTEHSGSTQLSPGPMPFFCI